MEEYDAYAARVEAQRVKAHASVRRRAEGATPLNRPGDGRASVSERETMSERLVPNELSAVSENKRRTPAATPTEDAAPTENDVGRAFMVIDEIMDGCPGEVDGLRVGDRVCAVGNVTWGFEDPSASPPAEVLRNATQTFADNENSVVRVVVLRRGERVAVEVTPRAWSGRGLVGCHMRSV